MKTYSIDTDGAKATELGTGHSSRSTTGSKASSSLLALRTLFPPALYHITRMRRSASRKMLQTLAIASQLDQYVGRYEQCRTLEPRGSSNTHETCREASGTALELSFIRERGRCGKAWYPTLYRMTTSLACSVIYFAIFFP